MFSDTERAALRAIARARPNGGSFARFHDDPVGFCRDVLGFEPWEGTREDGELVGQQRIMREVAENDFVTVPAGRAVGKSRLDAALALWFCLTRGPNARVILTAPTYRQVQLILWEEIRLLVQGAKIAIPGELAKMASTGFRASDGSQIVGITAERPEAFQGIRAARLMIIADEASGIEDAIFHVIDGNMAGGGKYLLTGNPTRALGYFRESMRSPRFRCHRLAATDSPNVVAGRVVIPGIATRDWVEERSREWGKDSPLYRIHVLGEVVEAEEGRLFTEEMIAAATAEATFKGTPATGRVVVGVDPAGDSGDGDESAFVVRRGNKVTRIHTRRGLTEDGHLLEVLGLIAMAKAGEREEKPLVVVDRDGYIGARVYATFSAYRMQHEDAFDLLGLRTGERARRKPLEIDRVRDEVWLALRDAFREGLTFPDDVKLTRELASVKLETHISGRSKVTPKDDLRKLLGRSPDRADALALTCWLPSYVGGPIAETAPVDAYEEPANVGLDPYAGMDAWRPR